jgi:hypothetical protein
MCFSRSPSPSFLKSNRLEAYTVQFNNTLNYGTFFQQPIVPVLDKPSRRTIAFPSLTLSIFSTSIWRVQIYLRHETITPSPIPGPNTFSNDYSPIDDLLFSYVITPGQDAIHWHSPNTYDLYSGDFIVCRCFTHFNPQQTDVCLIARGYVSY